jgi:hypothetical protein
MQIAILKRCLGSLVLVMLAAASSFACMCGDTRQTVAEARDNALMVFSGAVSDDEYRDGATFPDGRPAGAELVARFKIDRWWKGPAIPEVFLFTEQYQAPDHSISVSTCAYEFEVGKRYLVYAGYFLGRLRASYCSRTSVIENATEDLKVLGKGKPPIRRRREVRRIEPMLKLKGS